MTDARHPWNHTFAWDDHTDPPSFLTSEQVAAFDRDGFFVAEPVFTEAELAPIVAELDAFEAGADAFLRTQPDERAYIAESGAITFAPNLTAHSAVLAEFVRHPALAAICGDLVGPDVNLYWEQAVYKKPDKPRRFPWHQDNGYTFVDPQSYLTCWIALTDATVANGCPQVARGRHREGTLAHTYVEPLGWQCFESPDDVAVAEVAAGGIVVFSSLTPHLTGPNTTDAVRKAYIVQYAPSGAMALDGDATSDAEPRRRPVDDAAFQFPVLRNGEPVAG